LSKTWPHDFDKALAYFANAWSDVKSALEKAAKK
jgi:hypothetical protein